MGKFGRRSKPIPCGFFFVFVDGSIGYCPRSTVFHDQLAQTKQGVWVTRPNKGTSCTGLPYVGVDARGRMGKVLSTENPSTTASTRLSSSAICALLLRSVLAADAATCEF